MGATKRTTTTIHDDCDPAWEHPATFLFDVHESSQELHVAVFDSEDDNFNTFADALLGRWNRWPPLLEAASRCRSIR